MNKLLVLDLDGTLLKDDKTLSNYTLKVLKKWLDEENFIFLATFRSLRKVKSLNLPNFLNTIIFNDGAEILFDNKIILKNQISFKEANSILNSINKNKYNFGIEANDNFYCNFVNNIVKNDRSAKVNQFELLEELNIDKIILLDSNPKIKIPSKFKKIIIDGEFTTIKNQNANKEYCVKYLIEQLKIEKENVYVFGNDKNDLGLFENFENSIAVENACSDIKKKAKYITNSNNEDGVANFINIYLLGEKC